MRLFIALEIPDDIKKELSGLMSIPDDIAKVKWVEEKNIHLTLKFLGDVEEDKAENTVSALRSVKFDNFKCKVMDFGAFPNEDCIKVLWAGIEPHEEVTDLRRKIDAVLKPLGFQKDSKFHPHVTIGRVRFVEDKKRLKEWMSNLKGTGFEKQFEAGKFVLMRSKLGSDGPVYEDIQSYLFR